MKRLFLSLVLSLMLCGSVNAGTYYVSGAGGTYAVGDGSDGLTWAKAYTTIEAAITAMAGTDTDTLILDPTENFVQTSNLSTSTSSKTGGTLHIKSENSDSSEGCAISGSTGTWYLFTHSEADVTCNLTGLTFKDHHINATWGCSASILFTEGGPPTLTDIIFDNIDTTTTAGLLGGVFSCAYSDVTTITFDTVVFQNCDFVAASIYRGPIIDADATTNNKLAISNLTVQNCTADTVGNISASGIYCTNTFTLSGTNLIQNISTTTDTGNIFGFLRVEGASGVLTMTGSTTIDNVDAGSNTGCGFGQAILVGTHAVGNISGFLEVKNCDWDADSADRMTGLLSSIWGTADLNITGPEIYIHDNTGIKGMVVGSQGGRFDLDKVQIYDNIGRGSSGAFRMGGWTGCTLKNCLIYGNSVAGAIAVGVVGHIHLHSQATADSTVILDNCTFYGNGNPYLAGNILQISENGASGFDLIVTIRNCIFDNQSENEIYVEDNTGGDTDLSITYSNIVTGPDAVTGADTYEHNIASNPRFYNIAANDFTLRRNSPCIDTGSDELAYDYNDWRRPNGIIGDMGAHEYYRKTYGGMHQSVAKKTSGTILKVEESGLVNLDSTSGNLAIYLPPLDLSRGVPFFLNRDSDTGVNTITIYANEDGVTIGGAANRTLVTKYDTLLVWGGTDQWYCLPYTQ